MKDNGPVFIVGMNGSGTSMMLDSLGRHPALYAVPDETLMMPHIIGQARRFGDLDNDENFIAYGRYALDHLPVLRLTTGEEPLELPDDWLDQPRTIAGVFDGIFGSFAASQGKRRWCEKTPDHVQHIRLLSEIFPSACFVHMIRDGREVARSVGRRQLRHPELIIYRWKVLVEEGRLAGLDLGSRYHELRYEDLTSDPEEQMRGLCSFLGIAFDERVLRSRMPQNPARRKPTTKVLGTIGSNPVKWPEYFDETMIRRLEEIGGQRLVDLGYEVRYAAGDRSPRWWQLKLWRASDFIRNNALKMRRGEYRSWRKLIGKMVFSIKEYRSKRY